MHRPCPFCACEVSEPLYDDGRYWRRCTSCGATGPATSKYESPDDIGYVDWDTRPVPEKLERLAEILDLSRLDLIADQLTSAYTALLGSDIDKLIERQAIGESVNAITQAKGLLEP